MMQTVYDSSGNKIGIYDGDSDIGKVYDVNGNYLGEYWGNEIFDKNGMSQGYHNGEPEKTVHTLVLRSLLQ